jgi:cephalosporin-C deacetylase-like acetyl esterase
VDSSGPPRGCRELGGQAMLSVCLADPVHAPMSPFGNHVLGAKSCEIFPLQARKDELPS